MKNLKLLFVILFILTLSYPVLSQSKSSASSGQSFKDDFMMEINAAKDKLIALANAFPQEKFTWRPAEGIRSVSEVFMHVAGANYFLLSFAGEKMPEGFKPDMEKTVTDKKDIIKFLNESYDNVAKFIAAMDTKTLDKKLKYFGTEGTERHLLFILLDHNHEHLGQAIAYARMNGVVPPWSK